MKKKIIFIFAIGILTLGINDRNNLKANNNIVSNNIVGCSPTPTSVRNHLLAFLSIEYLITQDPLAKSWKLTKHITQAGKEIIKRNFEKTKEELKCAGKKICELVPSVISILAFLYFTKNKGPIIMH